MGAGPRDERSNSRRQRMRALRISTGGEDGRTLVSRFRSSHHCAAHSFANVGIKGTLAIYDSSAVFGFEVPTRTRCYNDKNFKSTALARRIHPALSRLPACFRGQSIVTFASLITFAHNSVSSTKSCLACARVLPIGSIWSVSRILSLTAGTLTMSVTSRLILSAIAAGVSGGATIAYQVTARNPGSPVSAIVGTS